MNRREGWVVAGVVASVGALVVLAWTLTADTTLEPMSLPNPQTVEARPRKAYPLLPPATLPRPDPQPAATREVEPAQDEEHSHGSEAVPKEASLLFSNATMHALADAKRECVNPWIQASGVEEAEFAMNALVVDGVVADIELLSVVEDLPADVVACVRDVAWAAEWPEFEMTGEVRFQRSVRARRSVPPDDL